MFNAQSLQVFTFHAPLIRKVLEDQRESRNQTKGLHGIQETGKDISRMMRWAPRVSLSMGAEDHQVSLVLARRFWQTWLQEDEIDTIWYAKWIQSRIRQQRVVAEWEEKMGKERQRGRDNLIEKKPLNSHFRNLVQQYHLPSVLSLLSLQNREFNETDSLLMSN